MTADASGSFSPAASASADTSFVGQDLNFTGSAISGSQNDTVSISL